MTPFWTDQYFSCPSQPSSDLPLNSLIVSDVPSLGATTGASAAPAETTALNTTAIEHSPTNQVASGSEFIMILLGYGRN